MSRHSLTEKLRQLDARLSANLDECAKLSAQARNLLLAVRRFQRKRRH